MKVWCDSYLYATFPIKKYLDIYVYLLLTTRSFE